MHIENFGRSKITITTRHVPDERSSTRHHRCAIERMKRLLSGAWRQEHLCLNGFTLDLWTRPFVFFKHNELNRQSMRSGNKV